MIDSNSFDGPMQYSGQSKLLKAVLKKDESGTFDTTEQHFWKRKF